MGIPVKSPCEGGWIIELNERSHKVLAALIKTYIATGEPVGSKTIQQALDMNVSSATIRNDMALLSELGLLEQPHTSAGRIPSQLGYRLYLDHLMQMSQLSGEERTNIDSQLASSADDPERFLESASSLLANMTRFAAVSTTAGNGDEVIARCELIPTGRRTAVILLVTSGGQMKSRMCRVDADLDPELLGVFERVANAEICGMRLSEISLPFMQTIAASLGRHAFSATALLIAVHDASRDASELRLTLDGQANLLANSELDVRRARMLMEFLSQREQVANLFRHYHGGIKVVLGSESRHPELDGMSIVVTRYFLGKREGGILGVIGPNRMDYAKIIPRLEYFALQMGRLLTEVFGTDDELTP